MHPKDKGFTLMELLVVISIIGLLSSIVLMGTSVLRLRARDAARLENIKALENVLVLYYADYGEYPKTFNPGDPVLNRRHCDDPNDYIPNVTPAYIIALPGDPFLNCSGVTHSWSYASDGKDYKLITHIEGTWGESTLVDPTYDDGLDPCVLDGPTHYHYGVWTVGAVCWSI